MSDITKGLRAGARVSKEHDQPANRHDKGFTIRVALIAGGNRHKTVNDVGVTCNNGVAQNQAGAIRHHRREVDKGQTQELWPQVMGSRNNTSQSSQFPVGQTRSDSASRLSHFGRLRLGTGTPTSRVLPLLRRDRD